MNPVLKIALEISNGVTMTDNRSHEIKPFMIENYSDSKNFDSIYFYKNGIEYRISNHELPNRSYMQQSSYLNEPLRFHKNNIEVIVKNGEIVNTKLNFNTSLT